MRAYLGRGRSRARPGARRTCSGPSAVDRSALRSISAIITAIPNTDPQGAEELAEATETGQVILAYGGTPASEHALRAAARLLSERHALVLVVWKSGLGFELLEIPSVTGLPPAPIDIRTVLEIDQSMYERAQRLAQKGAELAREAGFEAEALVVAEEPEIPISDTIVRIARERGAPAIVVGERAHSRVGEVFLGDTSRDVIRRAPCPVVVVRHADDSAR